MVILPVPAFPCPVKSRQDLFHRPFLDPKSEIEALGKQLRVSWYSANLSTVAYPVQYS